MQEWSKSWIDTSDNVTPTKCSDHFKELFSDVASQPDEITLYLILFKEIKTGKWKALCCFH